MIKGGYQIVDFSSVDASVSQGNVKIKNIFNIISNGYKPILITGFNSLIPEFIHNIEIRKDTINFSCYSTYFTITPDDNVMWNE